MRKTKRLTFTLLNQLMYLLTPSKNVAIFTSCSPVLTSPVHVFMLLHRLRVDSRHVDHITELESTTGINSPIHIVMEACLFVDLHHSNGILVITWW